MTLLGDKMADFRVGMSSFPPVDIGVSTNKNGRLRRFNVKGQMWSGRGSNPRPRTCKARALPTELPPQVSPSFSEEPIDCTSFGPCCKGRSHAALCFRGFAEFPRRCATTLPDSTRGDGSPRVARISGLWCSANHSRPMQVLSTWYCSTWICSRLVERAVVLRSWGRKPRVRKTKVLRNAFSITENMFSETGTQMSASAG